MTNRAKHTPGPWRESPATSGQPFGAVIADKRPIDRPTHWRELEEVEELGGYLIAESITQSNRPIIAAAPEMYEALELARDHISGVADRLCSCGFGDTCFHHGVLKKIDTTIAKARGEQV